MYDLINELNTKTTQLDNSIKLLRRNGTAYAEAERDYKVILREEALKMRDNGEAIGIINLTVYGIPKVAEARFKRDVAEATYKANQEGIASVKLQMRLIEAQIEREWGKQK